MTSGSKWTGAHHARKTAACCASPEGRVLACPEGEPSSWLAGFALRERTFQSEAAEERAAQAEGERESASRLAVAEERTRIARELHDVVAHALSVMVLQVSVVRRRGSADDETLEALANVEQAGRAALAEMRRLLDGMRGEGDPMELGPQPGLEQLDALLEEVRATGLDVRLHVHGERSALPPGGAATGHLTGRATDSSASASG